MATSIVEKQLGQIQPSNTSANQVYSPATATVGLIRYFTVSNNTGSAVAFQLFLDDDGSTYDDSTSIWEGSAPAASANDSVGKPVWWPMNNPSGNLACLSATANALTFTFWGLEIG